MGTKTYIIERPYTGNKVELATLLMKEGTVNSVTINLKKNIVTIKAQGYLFAKLERTFSFLKPLEEKKTFRVRFHYFDGTKAKDRFVVFPRPARKPLGSEFEFIHALQEDCMEKINKAKVGDSFDTPRISRDCNEGTMTLTRIR